MTLLSRWWFAEGKEKKEGKRIKCFDVGIFFRIRASRESGENCDWRKGKLSHRQMIDTTVTSNYTTLSRDTTKVP